VRVGVAIPTWGPFADVYVLEDFLSLVEELGFESAWFSDHVAIPPYATDRFAPPLIEPLSLAAWTLARHERLRIGTDVLVAPYRHPLLLAAIAGSVARLSGGRLVLGMGIGYLRGEFAALQIPIEDRATITDEVLDALRVLWHDDGPRHYEGRHIRFADVFPSIEPTDDAVPIWVGGNNAKARARAATRGDGWHPLYPTPAAYARGRADIEAQRAERGLTAPFTYSYSAALCRVMRTARVDWQTADDAAALRPEYRYAPEFPRTADGRPLLCGTAEQVAADIDSYHRSGVEHVVLRVWTTAPKSELGSVMDQLHRWAEVFGL
jgi:probable F420-dependent oxidoreductase